MIERGWAALRIDSDIMQPGVVVHVVPVVRGSLVPQNGHELMPLCWCHPVRLTDVLDEGLVLSHNDPEWPGASPDERVIVQ
jgi:hypothetical protein